VFRFLSLSERIRIKHGSILSYRQPLEAMTLTRGIEVDLDAEIDGDVTL
jgi:hypothetical protein